MQTVVGIEACEVYYEQMAAQRDALPFDIDGIVYKVNSLEQQDKIGVYLARTPVGGSSEISCARGQHAADGCRFSSRENRRDYTGCETRTRFRGRRHGKQRHVAQYR